MAGVTALNTIELATNSVLGLSTHNNNVASGGNLAIDATNATSAAFTFDGSAEANGAFTITAGGSGDHQITLGTGADSYTSTSTAGEDVTGTGGANTISVGGGADIVTSGTGVDTITFGTDDAVDTLITNNMSSIDIITDFDQVKADNSTAEDQIDVSVVAAQAMVLGTGDLVLAGNAATSVTAGSTSVVADVTAAYDLAGTATALVLNVSGTYAASTDLEDALEVGGARALTANGAFADDDAFLATYSDGTNTKLAIVEVGATIADDATFTGGSLRVTDIVQINGITGSATDAAAFLADNFDLIA
jgi:hypothetical protein